VEPTQGATARVRLIGERPKVYPNSGCVSTNVPDSGYPGGWKLWGLAASIGMPRFSDTPKDAIEVVVRAGEPATIRFQPAQSSYVPGPAGTGAPGSRRSAHCTVARTFVPEPGADYEVRGIWSGTFNCAVEVTELVATEPHGHALRMPAESKPAFGCPGDSRRSSHVPSASP
jgi:hypothetical protein